MSVEAPHGVMSACPHTLTTTQKSLSVSLRSSRPSMQKGIRIDRLGDVIEVELCARVQQGHFLMMTVNMDDGLQNGPGQHRNLQVDDEEALNSIMKDLAALGRCYTQQNSHKPKNRTLLYKQDLRVKLEHEREKRIIPFQRPLKIKELLQKVTEAFGQQMDMFFMEKELLLPLKTQEDLDQAVLTLSCSSGVNGLLRILLKTPKNNHYLQVNSSLHTGRTSPPPGSVPEEQQQIARQGSYTSIHSEGEFIPETQDQNMLDPFGSADNSLSSSCQSIDQALDRADSLTLHSVHVETGLIWTPGFHREREKERNIDGVGGCERVSKNMPL
ncbi:hypothetical protein PAMA_008535 [Pampus argenteus]